MSVYWIIVLFRISRMDVLCQFIGLSFYLEKVERMLYVSLLDYRSI